MVEQGPLLKMSKREIRTAERKTEQSCFLSSSSTSQAKPSRRILSFFITEKYVFEMLALRSPSSILTRVCLVLSLRVIGRLFYFFPPLLLLLLLLHLFLTNFHLCGPFLILSISSGSVEFLTFPFLKRLELQNKVNVARERGRKMFYGAERVVGYKMK